MLRINGFIYTADERDRVHPDGSVLAVDGRITAVGARADVDAAVAALDPAARSALRTLDAGRRMVLPGFVNAHWHDMFAARLAFGGAGRSADDRGDEPGFLARGGDMHRVSALFDMFCGLVPALTPDEAEAIARHSVWTQVRGGTTTLGEVGSLNRPEALVAAVRALGVRGAISTWAGDVRCAPGEHRPRITRDADDVLAAADDLRRLCEADRSGRVRFRPSAVYLTNMSDALGAGLADLLAGTDYTFATHVGALRNESAFVEAYFGATPVRRLDKLGLLTDRLMAIHCAFVDPRERQLLRERRVHVNHSPAKYGSSGESTLSETKLISQLVLAGQDVSLSTDGTVFPVPGMAENMGAAWQAHNELHADQTVVVPTGALAMATRVAARGLRWDEVGSLAVGKRADLVLVRTDDWRYLLNPRPLEAFLLHGGSTDIDTVVVDGRVVLADGRSTLVDEAELERDFLGALRSFSARVLKADTTPIEAELRTR